MQPTNREICAYFFVRDVQDPGLYWCECGNSYRQIASSGYHNLIRHLDHDHKDYVKTVSNRMLKDGSVLTFLRTSANHFGWIDWVVTEFLPLSFCEKETTRAYTTLPEVSRRALKRQMELVEGAIERQLRRHLPKKFGRVFDGWTSAGVHYVAFYAVYPPTGALPDHQVLLSFSPLDDEMDLSSQSMFDFIADTLDFYEHPWSSVLFFFVSDNCSVNQYIGSRSGIQFIGCASHRFNLAVCAFLEPWAGLVLKVHALMKKFSTIKGRACLKTVTELRPRLKNDTRWSSRYKMLRRYERLLPSISRINHATLRRCGADLALLTTAEDQDVVHVNEQLEKLHSITLKLQDPDVTLSDVRAIFDYAIEKFPITSSYLGPRAAIVNNPMVESGLVKLQVGQTLTRQEREACAGFQLPDDHGDGAAETSVDGNPLSFADEAMQKKRRVTPKTIGYMDTRFVPPASNTCERLFSLPKLVSSPLRQAMKPETLPLLVFLRANRAFWSKEMVAKIACEQRVASQ